MNNDELQKMIDDLFASLTEYELNALWDLHQYDMQINVINQQLHDLHAQALVIEMNRDIDYYEDNSSDYYYY